MHEKGEAGVQGGLWAAKRNPNRMAAGGLGGLWVARLDMEPGSMVW